MYADSALVEGSCSEEVLVPRQQPKPWRRLGLAGAVVGTLGTAGGVAHWARAEPSATEQWMQMGTAFMNGFSLRELKGDYKPTKARISMLMQEDGAPPPDAMTIDVNVKLGDQPKHPHFQFCFAAKEGQGKDLQDKFNALHESFKNKITNEQGKRQAKKFEQDVAVQAGKGPKCDVQITVTPNSRYADKTTLGEKYGDDTPKFTASAHFGRDIPQMLDVIDTAKKGTEAWETLPQSTKLSLSSEFSRRIAAGLKQMFMGYGDYEYLDFLASVTTDTKIVYRKQEMLESLPKQKLKWDVMGAAKMVSNSLRSKDITAQLASLHENSDGLTSILIQLGPMEFDITFENFKISHLFSKAAEWLKLAEKDNEEGEFIPGV